MSAIPKTPPLQPGDRLSPDEFLRRYELMPEVKKAELIEGIVYMPSPVRVDAHADPHFDLIVWAGFYRAHTVGVRGGDNATVRLQFGPNVPQPDAHLRLLPEYGGRSHVDVDRYLVRAPEWVGEIAASSASYDLHDKLTAYERNEVQEYVVWRVLNRAVDWFMLRAGKFRRLPLAKDGYYKSRVFPGLWLDPKALVKGNMAAVLRVLQKGLSSPEHKKFVASLQKWHAEHSP